MLNNSFMIKTLFFCDFKEFKDLLNIKILEDQINIGKYLQYEINSAIYRIIYTYYILLCYL